MSETTTAPERPASGLRWNMMGKWAHHNPWAYSMMVGPMWLATIAVLAFPSEAWWLICSAWSISLAYAWLRYRKRWHPRQRSDKAR